VHFPFEYRKPVCRRHAVEKGNDGLSVGIGDETQVWHFKADNAWISGVWHGELSLEAINYKPAAPAADTESHSSCLNRQNAVPTRLPLHPDG
jgi:hypothetical protein